MSKVSQTRKCNDIYDMNIHNIVGIQMNGKSGPKPKNQNHEEYGGSPRVQNMVSFDQKALQMQAQLL